MCLRLLDTDFLKGDKDIQIENTQVILNVEYNCISSNTELQYDALFHENP